MSRIKGKNTKPELLIRKHLYSHGLRYRLHANLPGKPDLTFAGKKIAVFINGCFWHRHEGCILYVEPKTNTQFWVKKIQSNVDRDNKNYNLLTEMGWRVIIIWECQVEQNFTDTITMLLNELKHADRSVSK